jgi:hypothetical protein
MRDSTMNPSLMQQQSTLQQAFPEPASIFFASLNFRRNRETRQACSMTVRAA